jgi:hypothetical protein
MAIFMIIYGTRGITSIAGSGQFHCPRCGPRRQFNHMAVRRWFTLYFIPLIPMWSGGEYVECTACSGTFGPEVMNYDPEADRLNALEEVKRVLVMAAIAEGRPTAARLDAVRFQFQRAGGYQLTDQQMADEARLAISAGANLVGFASQKALEWTPDFKAALFLACGSIILADPQRTAAREQICVDLGRALGYAPQQATALLRHQPLVH